MKNKNLQLLFSFLVLIILSSCFQNENKDNKIVVGMSIDEFKNIYPEIVPENYRETQAFSRKDTIAGIGGKWYYDFKKSKLSWFLFNKYFDEINQANFDKCLNATHKIIDDYKKKYGEPLIFEKGNTSFINPYKKRHWGYNVLKAVWQKNDMKFKVEFYFMGAKGTYNFLIKIEFHEKNYDYS